MRTFHLQLGLAVVLLASGASPAAALGLGKLEVLSALGEPLRAEIEVPELSPAEAASLQLRVSEPGPYQTPGVSYPSLEHGLQIELMRRNGGEPYLSLKSTQDIKEPLIGIVLDLKWRSGRLVRDYLMLLRTPDNSTKTLQAKGKTDSIESSGLPASRNTLQTQNGDTAGHLAEKIKPDTANLEQALVALVQENPSAFIDGNVNRMRAGVILNVPNQDKILATSPHDAHQWMVEQNALFDAYRGALAKNALKHPTQAGLELELQAPGHSASGSIQTAPSEAPPEQNPSDKLTLSQAEKNAQEAQLAEEKQAKAQTERLAELKKNIGELSQLQSTSASENAPSPSGDAAPPNEKTSAAVNAPVPNVPARTNWAWWMGGTMAALALMLGAGGWWAHRRRLHKRQSTVSTGTWSDIPFDETASDEDPLAQADQLIQAGQLEAAETHLKNALRNNPALLTAQAKLLEVYALRLHGSGLQGWHSEQVSPQQPDFKDFEGEPYEDDAPLGSGLPHGFQELPPISLDLNDDAPSR